MPKVSYSSSFLLAFPRHKKNMIGNPRETHYFPTITVYPCEDIALDHNITVSDLMTWNPWIGPSLSVCDTGIYANLPESSERPICVGTGTRSNTSSVTSAQRTTTTTARSTTPSLTTSDSPGAPTQTGIVAGCRKYYIAQAGDGCWAIASSNNINLDDFYGWNPAG